jgi:hypothetical protein
MRIRLHLRARPRNDVLLESHGSRDLVDSDIRGVRPFAFGPPHHRTLDVYGHPQYRLRRVA